MEMERHGIAMVVEDGVQVQQQEHPRRVERQAFLMARKTGCVDQGMGVSVVRRASALDFFWRIFARLAGYVTRVRRLFLFKLANNGILKVKEESRASKREDNVEGGLVETSRLAQCEPELAEIVVTSMQATAPETTGQGIHDVDMKMVEVYQEYCASKCVVESKDMHESTPLACVVEHTAAIEQSSSDPCRQDVPFSVACEPVNLILPELHGEDGIPYKQKKKLSQEQTACQEQEQNDWLCTAGGEKLHTPELQNRTSQDEELVDAAAINNKSDVQLQLSPSRGLSADNTDNPLKGSSDAESLDLTSSRDLKKRVSIKELNAVIAEQLSKFLQALERNMVPGKAERRRAIILATLVAIVVWARNAKNLHESMPLIRGSAINVHIRSRL